MNDYFTFFYVKHFELPLCMKCAIQINLPCLALPCLGCDVLVQGIQISCINVPLHTINFKSDLVSGVVKLGVRKPLPVEGINLIIGNDLAGGEVFPTPIVTHNPVLKELTNLATLYPSAFPACAVTRAQVQKFKEVMDLADFFLVPESAPLECTLSVSNSPLKVTREYLVMTQREDLKLVKCVKAADLGQVPKSGVRYFRNNGLLMRRWKPDIDDENCQEVR